MRIGNLCSRSVHTVNAETPLVNAVREMHRHHIGSIIVTEEHGVTVRPIGIVTDRDVMRAELTMSSDLFSLSAGDAMSKQLLTMSESTGLSEAIDALRRRGVRRAPVVNEMGGLCGIVTLDDLLPAVAQELKELADLIGSQSRRER